MDTYKKIKTGQTLTECEFYNYIMTGKGVCCEAGWRWKNEQTQIEKTGMMWYSYFKENPPDCSGGNCQDPFCPSGKEIYYMNIINEINIRLEDTFLYVELTNATYYNISADPPIPMTYTFNPMNGHPPQPITVGAELSINALEIADGIYKGVIISDDEYAFIEFIYEVFEGEFYLPQTRIINDINVDLNCQLYPEYPIEFSSYLYGNGATITAGQLKYDGDVEISITYPSPEEQCLLDWASYKVFDMEVNQLDTYFIIYDQEIRTNSRFNIRCIEE